MLKKILKDKKAFSLLELSVSTLIMTLLMVGALNIMSQKRSILQKAETNEKIEAIEKALIKYAVENGRLPCPARLDIDTDDGEFGKEQRIDATGECDTSQAGIFTSSHASATNLVYGAVPIKVLELYTDYALDGWDNKFSYIADLRFISAEDIPETAGITESFTRTAEESMILNNTDGDNIADNIIVVVISHGENGLGAFKGTLRNPLPDAAADEFTNIFDPDFDNEFTDDLSTSTFDDISVYTGKYDLIKSAGIEESGCLEADIPDYVFTEHGNEYTITWAETSATCDNGFCDYTTEVQSQDACPSGSYPGHFFSWNPPDYYPVKKCLKYGQWSNVMYECDEGCGDSNLLQALQINDAGVDDLETEIAGELWRRVKLGRVTALVCVGGKIGVIVVKCETDGDWTYIAGKCFPTNPI